MIIIYTGKGKGKTTAALGAILRAMGSGKTVSLVQIFKITTTSEASILKNLMVKKVAPFRKNFRFKTFGREEFIDPRNITQEDKDILKNALKYIHEEIRSKPFLLILDEILIALKFKIMKDEELIEIINNCKENGIHLILTGRGATRKVIDAADLVTRMKKIKHPFDEGKKALRGIDY